MKIEQIIVLHLYHKKRVTLQGIGTFHLNPSVDIPADNRPQIILPEDAVTFEYNPSATEDEFLIDTVLQQTKKLRPLASADLESFLLWQKQLLNINMAFNLGEIGSLFKTATGAVEFIPNKPLPLTKTGKLKQTAKTTLNKYNAISAKNNGKLLQVIAITILGVGLSAWVLYRFVFDQSTVRKFSEDKKLTPEPGARIISPRKESAGNSQLLRTVNSKQLKDSSVFKVVFFKTRVKEDAVKTLNEIYGFGHSPIMYSSDSFYKIAMPFNRPITDTLQIKDSLNKYNSLGNGSVEIE